MANIHYFREEEIDEEDKFLTVGGLIDILKDVNPQTRVFIRNVDEWGEKPVINNSTDSWELSDGLITDVKRANINQVTNKEEYIIIQGLINKRGFVTLDHEPYEEIIYHHTWLDKCLNKLNPITSMKQLKSKFFKGEKNCGNCNSWNSNVCDKSKVKVDIDEVCELWELN